MALNDEPSDDLVHETQEIVLCWTVGNLLGYGTVYLTEFLKANENYNKAGYVFLALLSIQFIANLFIESKRSSKFDDDDSDYEQYNDDEETEIDYVDVDGEYDVQQNSTVYNA